MRFGFFDQLPCAPGYSERQRYQDILAQIELGDHVGFDTVWLGELHFSRAFSILADPLMVLTAAAQRAPRTRLGPAATLPPLHNPVKTAEGPDTLPFAAQRRLPIFAPTLINPPDKLRAGLAVYRETLPRGTHGDTALAFPVHVTTSRAQAREECEPGLLRFLREAAERLRPLGQADVKSFEAFRQVLARIDRVTYADMDREMGVLVEPEYCVRRVRALKREYGMDEFICYFNQGGIMDHAMVRQSMTLFAQEVMPHCR